MCSHIFSHSLLLLFFLLVFLVLTTSFRGIFETENKKVKNYHNLPPPVLIVASPGEGDRLGLLVRSCVTDGITLSLAQVPDPRRDLHVA